VQLPYDNLIVDPDTSKRGDGSGDRFAVQVNGRTLTVWRIDGPPGKLPHSGWGQDLKMSWRQANHGEKQPPPYFPAGISPDRQYRGEVAHDPLVPRSGSVHVGKHEGVKMGEPKVRLST
jgi:hypothetical protein